MLGASRERLDQCSGMHPEPALHTRVMANDEQPPTMLVFDREGNRLDAGWSRSMKSLILTVGPPDPSGREWRQVSLDPDQAAQLRDFIAETHPA
jgi:hypothetical protein